MNIMDESPEMQLQLVSSHGMLAILEVLEGRVSRDVAIKLLQIINLVRSRAGHGLNPCSKLFSLSRQTLAFWRAFVSSGKYLSR